MKSLKAAAVIAGSLAVAGAAAPAFASNASDLTPTGPNGAPGSLTAQRTFDVRPVQHQSDVLDSENKDSVLSTVKSATTGLNESGDTGRLLGGLPLQGR